LSGNWADEYITDGYVLYDQLLRVWALKSYNHFGMPNQFQTKLRKSRQIEVNFTRIQHLKYHERAYNEISIKNFMPCSFSPAGYKTSLMLLPIHWLCI
jgi:hypothetical protein